MITHWFAAMLLALFNFSIIPKSPCWIMLASGLAMSGFSSTPSYNTLNDEATEKVHHTTWAANFLRKMLLNRSANQKTASSWCYRGAAPMGLTLLSSIQRLFDDALENAQGTCRYKRPDPTRCLEDPSLSGLRIAPIISTCCQSHVLWTFTVQLLVSYPLRPPIVLCILHLVCYSRQAPTLPLLSRDAYCGMYMPSCHLCVDCARQRYGTRHSSHTPSVPSLMHGRVIFAKSLEPKNTQTNRKNLQKKRCTTYSFIWHRMPSKKKP